VSAPREGWRARSPKRSVPKRLRFRLGLKTVKSVIWAVPVVWMLTPMPAQADASSGACNFGPQVGSCRPRTRVEHRVLPVDQLGGRAERLVGQRKEQPDAIGTRRKRGRRMAAGSTCDGSTRSQKRRHIVGNPSAMSKELITPSQFKSAFPDCTPATRRGRSRTAHSGRQAQVRTG